MVTTSYSLLNKCGFGPGVGYACEPRHSKFTPMLDLPNAYVLWTIFIQSRDGNTTRCYK